MCVGTKERFLRSFIAGEGVGRWERKRHGNKECLFPVVQVRGRILAVLTSLALPLELRCHLTRRQIVKAEKGDFVHVATLGVEPAIARTGGLDEIAG